MGSGDMLHQVQNYRKVVLIYEGLQSQINALLHRYEGGMQNMPEAEREQYKTLARKRDDVLNEMRWLEQQLLQEEDVE